MAHRLLVTGPRGRLDVEVDGRADGLAVVFHTGTPSAGRMFAPLVELGTERDLRHVAYSRPGYGASDRQAGRSVADCVKDVVAIAEALRIERFFTVGWSGGGPHALACAALLPERVIAAATIGSVAPRDADGLDWLAGMAQENLDEFAAAEAGYEQLVAYLEREGAEVARADGSDVHAALGALLSQVDREALTGEFAEHFAAGGREALTNGVWGWFDDDMAFIRNWGFKLAVMSRPVTIWQGQQDRFVPFAHGAWLADHVPGARAQLHEAHGHLSLALDHYGRLLDDLVAGAR